MSAQSYLHFANKTNTMQLKQHGDETSYAHAITIWLALQRLCASMDSVVSAYQLVYQLLYAW